MMSVSIRPASTVVLLRPGHDGPEVFLVRRHDAIAFMGGAHVFPGGRVEDRDADPAYRSCADGVDAAVARMADEPTDLAVGFHVAAIREMFEEAGVLLARGADGAMVSLTEADDVSNWRQSIASGRQQLLDLVHTHGWRLAIDALVYFARWVTPPIESRRFDARFFLAGAPSNQVAAHDTGETTDSVWIRPADAIAQCVAGAIALPPPTWTTLRWLDGFESVDTARAWALQRPIPRIEPGFIQQGETRIVTLPGDVTMPAVEGFEAKETRFLLAGGRWVPLLPRDGQ